jgi:hypothetical protein
MIREYYLFLHPDAIRENWHTLLNDPDFPYKDLKDPQEFIDMIARGEAVILGFQVAMYNIG